MGRAKEEWMNAEERGWETTDKNVCTDCVDDEHLKSVIETNICAQICDYCGKQADYDIAAPIDEIMQSVIGTLRHYYADPNNAGVPYDTAEGGYLVQPTDTADALLSLRLECHDELFEDIVAAITNDAWVEAAHGHWASVHDDKLLGYAWRGFVQHVKHRQRFFFTTTEPEYGQDIEPSRLMPALGAVVSQLNLIQEIPAKTSLFRVRLRLSGDKWPLDVENLGAPPEEKMAAGRMNPPGIRYLYLSFEERTAIAEVVRGPPCWFAVAEFQTEKDLIVLNLTNLPPSPFKFDYERLRERDLLLFLAEFVEQIAIPVSKDGSEHIEYVPTQIVCEYFASVFKGNNKGLDGLVFPSAVRPGGRNLVLFPKHANADPFSLAVFDHAKTVQARDWPSFNQLI